MTDIPKELIEAVRSAEQCKIETTLMEEYNRLQPGCGMGSWLAQAIVVERESRQSEPLYTETVTRVYPDDEPKCEGYSDAWIHAQIHLHREHGAMHSDGNHEVRTWIEERHQQQCDLLETAWGIIANANEGDWSKATDEWREAAERWRDEYHGGPPQQGDTTAESEGTAQPDENQACETCQYFGKPIPLNVERQCNEPRNIDEAQRAIPAWPGLTIFSRPEYHCERWEPVVDNATPPLLERLLDKFSLYGESPNKPPVDNTEDGESGEPGEPGECNRCQLNRDACVDQGVCLGFVELPECDKIPEPQPIDEHGTHVIPVPAVHPAANVLPGDVNAMQQQIDALTNRLEAYVSATEKVIVERDKTCRELEERLDKMGGYVVNATEECNAVASEQAKENATRLDVITEELTEQKAVMKDLAEPMEDSASDEVQGHL